MLNIAILAADEHIELDRLLNCLIKICEFPIDDIVVLFDSNKVTENVRNVVKLYKINQVDEQPLVDFASQRNRLHTMCNQSYILHIDADETIPKLLLDIIIDNLNNNITIDMIGIPRINKIIIDDNTITIEEIFGPNALDGKNRINWPDYQWRLLKNDQSVIWQGKIHEMPSGQTRGVLPESEQIAIQHIKNISKQLHQKNDYIKRWNNKR